MSNKAIIKALFAQHPTRDTLYEDENGLFWFSKETAKAQSKGGKVITHKRDTAKKTEE